ncbi:uncharacterized protein BDR25DRAFT_169500, partial [Lindgomyces ingoldianus]
MSSSEEAQALGRSEFWDERYAKADGDKPTHEWFRDFDALEPFFEKYLFKERGVEGKGGRVLHLGSGDSTVPYSLLERGYINQLCIDFSKVVVELMKSRHIGKPQVEWKVGDVRNMTEIDTKSVDVAFDKGTLDAMIYGSPWSPPEEVLENSGRYVNEVGLTLTKTQGLQVLFEQLHSSNEKSKEESLFRRGARKLRSTLDVLGGSMSLASPLAALDPIVNNAFGIIQSVMTIAIGVCGAEEKFQEHIQGMLERIPIIERCDDIWDSTRSPGSLIFQVLVRIYTDLLDFYFEAMDVLNSDNFFVGLQKSRFRQRLPEIVSSFTHNTEQLDKLINLEALALIQKIDDDHKEVEYYNSLKQRADEACMWIISTIDFREWLKDSNDGLSIPSSKFFILFGDMGSGKSVTTGFVVDFLISHPALSGSLKPFVCVYYCKNDNETNKARNIYRSILSQILTRMGQLKSIFMKWYTEAQAKNTISGRLLTLDELAYAVTLRMEEKNISSLSDLEESRVGSAGLLELISPFVSVVGTTGGAIVRIVHQSLKDLIVREAPADWGSHDNTTPESMEQRKSKLHSSLLHCCIKYLLLGDLEEKDLFPEEKLEAMERQAYDLEFLGHFNMDVDENQPNEPRSPNRSSFGQAQTRDFDPELAGFGKFYTYAACYWTEHFKQCSPDALPDVRDISKLARHGSLTLRNWMETYKRPNLTSSPQRNLNVEEFDELVVAAHFGSHAFLAKFLERGLEDNCIRDESPAKAVK